MTGAVTLAATAVAGVGLSAYEMSQQNSLQSQGLGLAKTTQQEQMYYNNMLQQLIANPNSVQDLPGFGFFLDTGSKAVASGMGASGFTGSGNEAAALTQFGQGLASSFYGQQTSLLASLSGVTAPSSPASSIGAATGAAGLTTNTMSQLLNSLGFWGQLGRGGFYGTGASAGTPAAITNPGTVPAGGGYTFSTGG